MNVLYYFYLFISIFVSHLGSPRGERWDQNTVTVDDIDNDVHVALNMGLRKGI